jgi:hypothetical protein
MTNSTRKRISSEVLDQSIQEQIDSVESQFDRINRLISSYELPGVIVPSLIQSRRATKAMLEHLRAARTLLEAAS